VYSIAYSPDGKTLASASGGGTVAIWDALTGKERLALPAGNHGPLRFSPDSKRLATATGRGLSGVKVWDVGSGQELATYEAELEGEELTFSADGRLLYLMQEAGAVNLLDLTMGEQLTRCSIGRDYDTDVSTDGRVWFVYYASFRLSDSLLPRVWAERARRWFPRVSGVIVLDVTTGHELVRVPRWGLSALSPDGKTLAVYNADGDKVELWNIPPRTVVHPLLARALAGLAIALTAWWWRLRRKGRVRTAS
jgi:WD40 repeat protein